MYTAEINRVQPACLLLLIDQSSSMAASWADSGATKAIEVARTVNRLLGNAVLLCSKGDDRVHDYFQVGVIGYRSQVESMLEGSSVDQPLVPISQIAINPKRVDRVQRRISDGAGGVVEVATPMPVWVDPVADGWTPMVAAVETAEAVVREWCASHPLSFPPVVINVTDGASTDGDPQDAARRLRSQRTADGAALLFNVHLSSGSVNAAFFPATAAGLTDRLATVLFEMSSPLPPSMLDAAAGLGYEVGSDSRGFLYNAEAAAMIEFLDIGTRVVTPTPVCWSLRPAQKRRCRCVRFVWGWSAMGG